ncbi:MAG: energy-coupling factor ABC transporter ATP-binding protein [Thermoplasmata archaeon]
MIEIDSLSIKDRKGNRLLDEMEFYIDSEDLTIICGQPGSGKTLLMKAMKGIISEDLKLEGKIRKKGDIGLIFQEPRKQMVRRNVKMEAAFDLENKALSREMIEARIEKYSDFLGAKDLLHKDIDELSHGELTKVAILSTLVREPDILLLDEPISTLDHDNRMMLLNIIRGLRKRDTKVLIAEHDIRDLVEITDKIILLKDGSVLSIGEPEEMKLSLYKEGVKIPFEWKLDILTEEEHYEDKD